MVLALFVFLLTISLCITGDPLGVLINSKNLMSLSRFQMSIWTILVIASLFCYALIRIKWGLANALDIKIDEHLLGLMGISALSSSSGPR